MKFNAICGLPRSGSTLLCNVLNQNPRFYASSTSCLARSIRSLSNVWTASPEIKSDLIVDKTATDERMARSTRALIESWYADRNAEVVFDKDRHWNHSIPLLQHLYPDAVAIVCVRDLRSIFASVEKRHSENPLLEGIDSPNETTKLARADRMFSPNGMIGQNITGIEDIIRRKPNNVLIFQYETFVRQPQLIIDRIYSLLGEEAYEHDFDNVKSTATDQDALYLNKFPHDSAGKIEAKDDNWAEHVPQDIAGLIMQKFSGFNRVLGYQ